MHFDSQKYDFNFGRENAYHINCKYENFRIRILL